MKRRLLLAFAFAAAAWPAGLSASDFKMMDENLVRTKRQQWQEINLTHAALLKGRKDMLAEMDKLSQGDDQRKDLLSELKKEREMVKFLTERQVRTWKATSGSKVNATLVSQTWQTVRLRSLQGAAFEIKFSGLCTDDQDYLTRLQRVMDTTDPREYEPPPVESMENAPAEPGLGGAAATNAPPAEEPKKELAPLVW